MNLIIRYVHQINLLCHSGHCISKLVFYLDKYNGHLHAYRVEGDKGDDNLPFYFVEVSIEEFVLAIETPIEKPIMVGDYRVEFSKDGIKVGCTSIDSETVEKIYKKFKEHQEDV